MARRKILAGTTSLMLPIFIQDTSSTVGAGLGSLVYNSSGLAAKYRRAGDSSWTTITLATATLGTFTSGGFITDGGPVTGGYELGVPDAAVASGAKWVEIVLYGATNMLAVLIEIELDAINYQDGVRAGLTALPNAAAEASGGLYTRGTGAGQINQDANGRIDTNIKAAVGTAATLDANNVLNVSTKYIGGTLQTARDIGASVLLSAGTGTGQLDFTSGVVKSNLSQIIATALTETSAGYLAAAFKKLFDVASPVLTAASVNQSADNNTILANGTYGNSALKTLIDALSTAITNLNNLAALCNIRGPSVAEIPDSGTTQFKFIVTVFDQEGKLVDLNASPTVTAANAAGTDRSSNLSSVTHVDTGQYEFTYGVASNAAEESIVVKSTGTVGAGPSTENRFVAMSFTVANYDSLTIINTISTNLNSLITTVGTAGVGLTNLGDARLAFLDALISSRLASSGYTAPDNSTISTINTKLGTPAASVSEDIAAVKTDTGNLITRIPSALFSGITSLGDWLRRAFRKDTGTAGMIAAEAEIKTGGTATYTGTTDNLEAIKDAEGGDAPTAEEIADAVDTQLSDTHGDGSWQPGGESGIEVGSFTDAAKLAMRAAVSGVITTIRGPVIQDSEDDEAQPMRIVIGDDYLAADGREITFDCDGTSLPALTDAAVILRLRGNPSDEAIEVEGEVTVPTGDNKQIIVELTEEETSELLPTTTRNGKYELEITDAAGHVITPPEFTGELVVVKSMRPEE